jgi:hypothetical protein
MLATFRPSLGNILPCYVHTHFRELIGKATFSPDASCRARTVGLFAVARWRRTKLVEKDSCWGLIAGICSRF